MENVTPQGTPAKRALAALDTPPPAEPLPPRRTSVAFGNAYLSKVRNKT
jgi:hypothetical protein